MTSDPHGESAALAALSASELSARLVAGEVSSREATESLIARIDSLDSSGPAVRSIIEIAPDAIEAAARLDGEREQGRVRGPLHGVPVIVKDNLDTVAPLHTTAGSLVLPGSPSADSSVVAALRRAGLVVLGKANLSEWANFRGRPSSSGWSGAGGQTRNPHVLDRSPGGSSAGSAAALAARLAPLAVGTETDGSIICPAAACGVAGLKPTVGLVSRAGIVPISSSQDTAGPMGRSVEDLALLLEVMTTAVDDGIDAVAASAARPAEFQRHYLSRLGDGDLRSLRVGVLRSPLYGGMHPGARAVCDAAVAALSRRGAQLVDPLEPDGPLVDHEDEMVVLQHEFKDGLERYLATRGSGVPQSLHELALALSSEPDEHTGRFGLHLIEASAETEGLGSRVYLEARARNLERARTGIDRLLLESDVVVLPSMPPAWLIDHLNGDAHFGASWSPPAVAGYPSATLPVGMVGPLPVGLTVWGAPFHEHLLLQVLFALECELGSETTRPVPRFLESASEIEKEHTR